MPSRIRDAVGVVNESARDEILTLDRSRWLWKSIVSDVKRGPAKSSLCTRRLVAEARSLDKERMRLAEAHGSQQSNGRHRVSRRTNAMILAGPRTSILLEELITWFGAGDGPLLRVLATSPTWLRHLIVYCGAVLPRACNLESILPCCRFSH